MKVVIIGGSGLIGSKLVARLREQGHEAVPASPDYGRQHAHRRGTGRSPHRRGRRRRRVELAVVRRRGGAQVLRDLDRQSPCRRSRGGCGSSRRVVGRRQRPGAGERLPPRQGRPGEADQKLIDPVLDRPRRRSSSSSSSASRTRRPTGTRCASPPCCSSR